MIVVRRARLYSSPGWGTKHPRIQILTVAELLEGTGIDYPSPYANVTFKKAPKTEPAQGEIQQLPL